MGERTPLATVESALAAFNTADTQGFLDHFAEDMCFWMNGRHGFSGKREGKGAFVELVGLVGAGLSKMITLEIRNTIVGGEWVVLETDGDARLPDGSPYRNRYCMLWRVREGKIAELREYNDASLVVESFPGV